MKRILLCIAAILFFCCTAQAEIPDCFSQFDAVDPVIDPDSTYYFCRKDNMWQLYREDGTLFLDIAWPDEVYSTGFTTPFTGFEDRDYTHIYLKEDGINYHGVVDKSGEYIVPPIYENVLRWSDGSYILKKDGKCSFTDASGEIYLEFECDEAYGFSEGLAPVRIGGKFGFIDTNGTLVIQPQFMSISDFENGLNVVCIDEQHYGVIDRDGNYVIPPIYLHIEPYFHDGYAIFETDMGYGILDTTGKIIVQPMYSILFRGNNGSYRGECNYTLSSFRIVDGQIVPQ